MSAGRWNVVVWRKRHSTYSNLIGIFLPTHWESRLVWTALYALFAQQDFWVVFILKCFLSTKYFYSRGDTHTRTPFRMLLYDWVHPIPAWLIYVQTWRTSPGNPIEKKSLRYLKGMLSDFCKQRFFSPTENYCIHQNVSLTSASSFNLSLLQTTFKNLPSSRQNYYWIPSACPSAFFNNYASSGPPSLVQVLGPSAPWLKHYLNHLKMFYLHLNNVSWWDLDSILIWISPLRSPWNKDLGARSIFRLWPWKPLKERGGALPQWGEPVEDSWGACWCGSWAPPPNAAV